MPTMPNATHSSARTARRPLLSTLLCACIALCLFSTAPEAHAGRKKNTSHAAHSGGGSASTQKKIKTKHYRSPSEETRAERDRRLYRECWGRPNAGACLGYTRR